MKKFAKLLCVALCVLLCASVLFSAGFAAYGHNHDCMGEDCLYCQAFSLQQELMRLVLLGCLTVSVSLAFLRLVVNMCSHSDDKKQHISLVTDKVKLTA